MSVGARERRMILEAIVTTVNEAGAVNIAPMGPHVDEAGPLERFVLRPFQSAQTFRNLMAHPEGVLHVTDDVLLFARATIGRAEAELVLAKVVRGWRLADCCRAYEFRIENADTSQDRARLEARVVHVEWVRDFFGFNRARHACVEAAILASRVGMLSSDDIRRELERLRPLVDKTGGSAEHAAFTLLSDFCRAHTQGGTS